MCGLVVVSEIILTRARTHETICRDDPAQNWITAKGTQRMLHQRSYWKVQDP